MSDRLRVLLVEDNPGDADLIVELLPIEGPVIFEVDTVDRLSKALECVGTGRFDIILLDFGLPDSDGLDTLRAMRSHAAGLPLVVLTGNNDEQLGLAAIQEGAQDYLIKGQIDKNQLIRSINYAVARKQGENILKELNDTLEERIVDRTAQLISSNKKLQGEIVERKRTEEVLRGTFQELHAHKLELEMQNNELRHTQHERDASRSRYFDFYNQSPVGYLTISENGLILEANFTAVTLLGVAESALINQAFSRFVLEEDQDIYHLHRKQNMGTGEPEECELRMRQQDGTEFWVHLVTTALQQAEGGTEYRIVMSDITDRKRKEKYREMGQEILQTLNDPGISSNSFQHVVDILKKRTGFDAVGIRLQDGDDFPYFAYSGFPQKFIQHENTLLGPTVNGELCRDEDGNIRLECTCGLVLSGKADPTHPLFTPGGSFWTNDSLPLLDIPPSEDPRFQPRNQCIFHDYASFALIPIRNTKRIVGLIQFNDHHKECFTLNSIAILEGIASNIGAALMRKQSEEALQESEAKYRSLFENMTNGFALNQIVVDETGKPIDYIFREVNSAFEKHTGLKSVDILNKKVTQVLPGIVNDPADWIGMYGKVALTGEEIRIEQYLETLGRWYSVIAYRPIPNYFAMVFEDITEKRRADEIESSLAAIVASSEDAIIGTDLNGIIQTWNVGAENIYGYTAKEVIGKNISLLVPLGQGNRNAYILKQILRNEKVENREVDRVRKDGTIKPVSIFVSAIKDMSGTAIGISRIAHDITKQKEAERLEIANVELEQRVEQRTQELQEKQKQFLHAEKLSAIGKLSASIAHEFNNPLQGILSILKGVKKRATMDEEDKELLDAAISEGNRIKDLIRNLQEFNRPSLGKKTTMDLHQALDALLILQKSDLNGRRITVVRNYAEQLPLTEAVSDQIKQVFLNLLTNAADACNHHGGLITVRTWQEDRNRVAVAIKDTGMGIKPEDMDQIFQPFYSTKEELKGTGLGLSVSYGIVKKHHGEIRVESQPGVGTIFTVLLPIKGAEETVSIID